MLNMAPMFGFEIEYFEKKKKKVRYQIRGSQTLAKLAFHWFIKSFIQEEVVLLQIKVKHVILIRHKFSNQRFIHPKP